MPNINMPGIASLIAQQGRNGDTMLMHVAPEEVKYLDSIGGITRNPVTDLPEAFKLKDLLPFVGSAVLGPAFKAVGFSPGVSSFLASTASTMLGGGSLEKGIMSGLVSSSIGRLGRNLSQLGPDAAVNAETGEPIKDTGYKFGIFKKPEAGTFGSRYSEAIRSPEFNPIEQVRLASEGGLENFLEQIQKPGVMIPFSIGAGELARLNAEERYARDLASFQDAQKRRRSDLQRKYPQILPGPRQFYPPPTTGFMEGGAVQREYDGQEISLEGFPASVDPRLIEQYLSSYEERDTTMPTGEDELLYDEAFNVPQQPATAPAATPMFDEKGNLIAAPGYNINEFARRMAVFGAAPQFIPDLTTPGTAGLDIASGNLYQQKKEQAVKNYEKRLNDIRNAGFLTPEIEQSLKTNLENAIEQYNLQEVNYLNTLPQRQILSDLLTANKFEDAYKFAQDNGMQSLLLQVDELKNLRAPFTKEEAKTFMKAMPYEFILSNSPDKKLFEEQFKFDPEGAEERGALTWIATDQNGQFRVSEPGKPIMSETGYPMISSVLKGKPSEKEGNFGKFLTAIGIAAAIFGGVHLLGALGGSSAAGAAGTLSTFTPSAAAAQMAATGSFGSGIASGIGAIGAGTALTGGGGFVAAPTIGGMQTIVVPAAAGGTGGVIGAGTGILAGTQVLGGGSAGAGAAPATTTPPVDPIDEILIQAGKAKDVSLLGPGSLASTSLIKGTPDIPVDIYGNPIETVTVTGTAPVDGSIVAPAVVGAGTAATTAGSTPTSTVVEPPVEEFVISTGNPDFPYVSIPAGSMAEKILQETKPVDTGRTESLTDKVKDIAKDTLTDYAKSQALSAALSALIGGTAVGGGGGSAAAPGYQGTGGLGYLPEGQERRQVAVPEDYMHGFMPEFMFFENLNPPALIDTGTPGPESPERRDFIPKNFDEFQEPVREATGGMLPRRKVYSERGYLDLLQGYQEGGMVEEKEDEDKKEDLYEDLPGPVTDGNKRLVDLTKQVILGQVIDRADEIVQKFIDMFGVEAFQDMREDLLEEAMPNSVKEGMIPGDTGGMDDMVDGVIGNQERVAVSPGEYIIPADVVAALGDGNSKKGEKELDALLDRVRKSKYGSTKQPPPIDIGKVMPV